MSINISQIKKSKYKELRWLAQGHIVNKQEDQGKKKKKWFILTVRSFLIPSNSLKNYLHCYDYFGILIKLSKQLIVFNTLNPFKKMNVYEHANHIFKMLYKALQKHCLSTCPQGYVLYGN